MNNATDSRITAHLLSTAHYVAACNALLLALSAKYGGAWFAVQLVLAAVLLYCHIRIHFDRRVFQDFFVAGRTFYNRSGHAVSFRVFAMD